MESELPKVEERKLVRKKEKKMLYREKGRRDACPL